MEKRRSAMVYITDLYKTDVLFQRTTEGPVPVFLRLRNQDSGDEFDISITAVADGDYWRVREDGDETRPIAGQYDYILGEGEGRPVDSGVLQVGAATDEVKEYKENLTYNQYDD